MRSRRTRFGPALFGAALSLMVAAPLLAGPPWISVEVPANPHHPSTRGAAFMVRLYHHSDAIEMPVKGRAEGWVKGKRVSAPLRLTPTVQSGVYAVRDLPKEAGAWVLVITMEQSPTQTATALVRLGPQGEVASVHVPSDVSRDGWYIPRAVTPADVEAELKQAVAMVEANELVGNGAAAAALPWLVLPLSVMVFGGLRRRTRRED